MEGKAILEKTFLKMTYDEKWDEEKALRQRREKKEKSRVRKAGGIVEKALVVKRARTTRPRA